MYPLGSRSGQTTWQERTGQGLQPIQNSINDNYSVDCGTGQKDFVNVSGKADSLKPPSVVAGKKDRRIL